MDSAALLTPSDVNVIRRYVHTKYAPLPGSRKAEIVAEAVRGALERRLPDLPDEVKRRVTGELIRRCLVGERRGVVAEDVLDVCADEELDGAFDPEPLARWIEEQTSGRWTRQQVESRLYRGGRADKSAATAGDAAHGERREAGAVVPLALQPAAAAPAPPLPAGEPAADAAAALPAPEYASGRGLAGWRRHAAWLALVLALGAGAAIGIARGTDAPEAAPGAGTPTQAASPAAEAETMEAGMPAELRYADIDADAVKAYLNSRDSLLTDEPYFGAIVASARKYDVNPLLLFAITGQEQGFVPRSGKQAKRIANNPFNVFHSWQEYNTDIADSSAIAAKLIAKLGASRPAGEEPFAWLNRAYAEDPAWADGVRQLFAKLTMLPPGNP